MPIRAWALRSHKHSIDRFLLRPNAAWTKRGGERRKERKKKETQQDPRRRDTKREVHAFARGGSPGKALVAIVWWPLCAGRPDRLHGTVTAVSLLGSQLGFDYYYDDDDDDTDDYYNFNPDYYYTTWCFVGSAPCFSVRYPALGNTVTTVHDRERVTALHYWAHNMTALGDDVRVAGDGKDDADPGHAAVRNSASNHTNNNNNTNNSNANKNGDNNKNITKANNDDNKNNNDLHNQRVSVHDQGVLYGAGGVQRERLAGIREEAINAWSLALIFNVFSVHATDYYTVPNATTTMMTVTTTVFVLGYRDISTRSTNKITTRGAAGRHNHVLRVGCPLSRGTWAQAKRAHRERHKGG